MAGRAIDTYMITIAPPITKSLLLYQHIGHFGLILIYYWD